MGERSPSTASSARASEDRLDSWKEIAAYLNRDVKTVQRWEKREAMPVHRHQHDRMGSVYASRAELDAWVRGRNLQTAQENGNEVIPPDPSAPPPLSQRSTSWIRWKLVLLFTALGAVMVIGAILWFQRTEYFWRNPIAHARFETVTDFGGVEQAAAVSRDGHLVAFLSDRDGQMDVWVTQVGSGEFHNLTRGSAKDLANPSIRVLGFSPDGSLVTYWARRQGGSGGSDISIRAVANTGGTAETIPRRRGGVRLVARWLPTRVPHARARRPAVRVRRQPWTRESAHLHGAGRASLPLSPMVAR